MWDGVVCFVSYILVRINIYQIISQFSYIGNLSRNLPFDRYFLFCGDWIQISIIIFHFIFFINIRNCGCMCSVVYHLCVFVYITSRLKILKKEILSSFAYEFCFSFFFKMITFFLIATRSLRSTFVSFPHHRVKYTYIICKLCVWFKCSSHL